MDTKIFVAVLIALVAIASCESTPEAPAVENTDFVPGVFIAADALKSLQEKAQRLDSDVEDTQTEPPKVSKKSDQISDINLPDQSNQGYQPDQQILDQQQMNPPMGNQQNYLPNQVYANQPILNQPTYGNQQPVLYNQQPGYNQQLGYQQPSFQQPGYQQNNMGIQPFVQNPQAFLVAQQPGFQNQQGMLVNQQPTYQQPMLVAQQPNQQLFVPNGQMAQPNMIANPNMAGNPNTVAQPNFNPANGALLTNQGQGPSNVYAMVPINNQNTLPNPNLGNNNAYFVPVQQVPSNGVLLNNGK